MTDLEFAELFEKYMSNKRNEMKEKYNRVLPSGELIFNRFDKAKYIKCGKNTSVYDTSVVMGDVEIGDNVWVGPYTLLEGINAKLKIGDFVSIDSGVMIYTHDSTDCYLRGGGYISKGQCRYRQQYGYMHYVDNFLWRFNRSPLYYWRK